MSMCSCIIITMLVFIKFCILFTDSTPATFETPESRISQTPQTNAQQSSGVTEEDVDDTGQTRNPEPPGPQGTFTARFFIKFKTVQVPKIWRGLHSLSGQKFSKSQDRDNEVGNNQETPRVYFTTLLLYSSVRLCISLCVSRVPQRCDSIYHGNDLLSHTPGNSCT